LAAKPGKGPDRRSRAELLEADEEAGDERPQLDLPEIGFGAQIVDYLFEIGPTTGGEVITFTEMRAWSEASGVQLDAWESEMVRRLSSAYLAEYDAAQSPDRPPPSGARRSKAQAAADEALILKMMSQYEAAPDEGATPDPSEARPTRRRSPPAPAGRALRARAGSRGPAPPE
jgi:hypothetical protein